MFLMFLNLQNSEGIFSGAKLGLFPQHTYLRDHKKISQIRIKPESPQLIGQNLNFLLAYGDPVERDTSNEIKLNLDCWLQKYTWKSQYFEPLITLQQASAN